MADTINRLYNVKKCLHFDAPTACGASVIQAHTVQQRHLATIARDHKVYTFRMEPGVAISKGEAKEKLISTRRASTVPCFCNSHDQAVFSPIEDEPYTGTEQQLFLYGYRATVFSYYMSLRGRDGYEWMLSHDYSETIEVHI